MAIALATKPGINGANTLSIPKEWDSTWFRKFIANSLKGADVRNAIGADGIVITGNISTPYATIGFGAPVTLPGAVTITAPASGLALTVNSNGSLDTMLLDGAGRFSSLLFQNSGVLSAQIFTDTLTKLLTFTTNAAGWGMAFNVNGIGTLLALTTGGAITGLGPSAGVQVDMTPDRGTFTLTHTGFTTAVTSTATWYRIGNMVILNTGSAQGTSNATTWTASGLPAAIRPVAGINQTIVIGDCEDAGVSTAGNVQVTPVTGALSFGKGFQAGGAWTASGTKGFSNTGGTTFCYILR